MSEEKQTGWKDSNWYVGLSGFWKEYRKHKIGIIGIIMLALFVGMAIGAPFLATHDPAPNNKVAPSFLAPGWIATFDTGSVENGEYIENNNLTEAPEAITSSGPNAGEFSGEHYLDDGNGKVNLTWDHQSGSMVYPLRPPLSPYPDSADYIYFTHTFDWEFDRFPSDVNISINYAVSSTGNFTQSNGGLMFKVYVWLIDSSGNWEMVYRSFPPYTEVYQNRRIDLNWFNILAGWEGMIENEEGVQEDPRDELTVACGIAPTSNFEDVENSWNGTVTASFDLVSLYAYGDYYGVLGTTDKGGDAWSQLVYGSRISLTIGILATALSTAVGVIVGLVAGYFGGKIDEILMRVVDFLLVIPGLPLMMVLAAFLGPTIENIIVVIAILGWTGTSRLIRSQVMSEKNKAYVESARAIGASDTYIIFRHILPNVTPILFANITLGVVGAILSESGLSFLGLTDPNEPSWGRMLADAQGTGGFSSGAWWVVVFPGMMITLISLAFTFVGHTLDQVLNPRLRER